MSDEISTYCLVENFDEVLAATTKMFYDYVCVLATKRQSELSNLYSCINFMEGKQERECEWVPGVGVMMLHAGFGAKVAEEPKQPSNLLPDQKGEKT